MEHITEFFEKYKGQAVYYPATFEASALDANGNFLRSFQWRIEESRRDEFQRAVKADGLKPSRFRGWFIS